MFHKITLREKVDETIGDNVADVAFFRLLNFKNNN